MELQLTTFSGKRCTFNSAVIWAAVCVLDAIRVIIYPFRQLHIASVTPVGCVLSNVVVCWHYPGYHSSRYTTKICCSGPRRVSETRTNNLSTYKLWYVY